MPLAAADARLVVPKQPPRDPPEPFDQLRARDVVPDLALCSPARRTRETLDILSEELGIERVAYPSSLYSADAGACVAILRKAIDAETVLLVGHNPTISILGRSLAGDGEPAALNQLHAGFPTAGVAILKFEGAFAETDKGQGHVEAFLTPPKS